MGKIVVPEIKAKLGEHVSHFLERTLVTAMLRNAQVIGIHNNRKILISPSDNIDGVYGAWDEAYHD